MLKAVVLLCALGCVAAQHTFFRSIERGPGTRRLFGGIEAPARVWPAVCALLDASLSPLCSCAVLAPRWVLTAAHCAQNGVAYVQYNGRNLNDSSLVTVKLLYAHPKFKAEVKDLGMGPDVVTLEHDVGLVRTRGDMLLSVHHYFPQPFAGRLRSDPDFLRSMLIFNVDDLRDQEIQILGFGMSEAKPAGERLRETHLRLTACGRDGWLHCACAVGATSGVCSGDSGGPVLFNNTQIGVMSMGPIECGSLQSNWSGREGGGREVVSVFTALRPYAALINDTIHEVDSALRMREVARAAAPAANRVRSRGRAVVCAVSLLLCRSF